MAADAENSFNAVFPVNRQASEGPTFSDWLLETLGIPVVDIFQGGRNFKLNFRDLARLIYHNQSPDPHGIYKPAEVSGNFVSDSLEVRRAIFQVLIGKTLIALYEAIGALKRAEKDRDSARTVVAEYTEIVSEILSANGIKEIVNTQHLAVKIRENQEQLEKLLATRSQKIKNPISADAIAQELGLTQKNYETLSSQRLTADSKLMELYTEKARLEDVLAATREDVERIQKILYTHEQLKLFSPDTCPYCLNSVERPVGKCVCGCNVEEENYRRFFYSASEYLEILKSKTKSLDTLRAATKGMQTQVDTARRTATELRAATEKAAVSLAQASERASNSPDEYLELLEERIFELRNIIVELEQALKMEKKLERLQARYDQSIASARLAKAEVDRLDAASRIELATRMTSFDSSYSEMLGSVLAACRTAHIDRETYLPVINNGEYREASADVPKRFLYYLTLLKISLIEDLPFPRLLLVDTPETAGIDLENLLTVLRQISLATDSSEDYQILLSTGVGKYPPEYDDRVALRLRENSKLLHKYETVEQ